MKQFILPAILISEIIFFTWIGDYTFKSPEDFLRYFQSYSADLLTQSAPVLLAAFGMTLILATAGIDLSIASMIALISCVMSSFDGDVSFWWKAVPLGLLVALVLGLTNGSLIAVLDVPPIIATLGTMILFRGLCFTVMGDLEKSPFFDVPGYEWFGRFPGALLLISLVYLGLGAGYHYSRKKRELLMIGGNPIAARYAGIPVDRRLIQVYVFSGFMAFLSAVCFTARNSSVSGSSLTGMELQVIAAVILGGTRVQGGYSSLSGTFFGVFIIAVLDEGLRGAAGWGEENLPFKLSYLQYVLIGIILIGGVWMNTHLPFPKKNAKSS
ncbi:MAG TPA: ABC transporter permease [Verrucomicrobiales bacterium]|nr:ABC transporter permease [Verrucomicrobiales bacterium]HIL70277.1 ABC transporter permease [Verrucomicrobiota bacterium]